MITLNLRYWIMNVSGNKTMKFKRKEKNKMKKFSVKSYDFQGSNTPAIDIIIEADTVSYENNGLVVFKKKMTELPIAVFSTCKVWIREQE